MAMYRGDGANHAVRDVWDFVHEVGVGKGGLGARLERYEESVIRRTGPAVRASRRAAVGALCFGGIEGGGALLGRRVMWLEGEEGEGEEGGEGGGEGGVGGL